MAKNDDLTQVFDHPQLQIVEVGTPVVDRIRELGNIVNRISHPPSIPKPKADDKSRWN